MSDARKCDRCGTCWDPINPKYSFNKDPEVCRFKNPIFQRPVDIELKNISDYLVNGGAEVWIDLCPLCTQDFIKFMRNEGIFKYEQKDDE